MMQRTNINWCTHTWNPIVGCTPCSPGCANCYAAALHGKRHRAHLQGKQVPVQYDKPFHEIQFFSERLTDPIRARKPCTVFVCSMGDLFHESILFNWIDRVICAMALTPRHRYMILTKRPERMMNYFIDLDRNRIWLCLSGIIGNECFHKGDSVLPHGGAEDSDWWGEEDFPLPNLWLGVTVCNQREADEKIPILLQTPAAHRFISIEPMLGPVDLKRIPCSEGYGYGWSNPIGGSHPDIHSNFYHHALDLVIVGGETGKNARPMHPDWVRSVRDQCGGAGVPFHFKGWGEWIGRSQVVRAKPHTFPWGTLDAAGNWFPETTPWNGHTGDDSETHEEIMLRLGAKNSGRLLDGREHNGAEEVTR